MKDMVLSAKPGTIVRGTHPSKIAKGGAASVVVAPTIKTKGGRAGNFQLK